MALVTPAFTTLKTAGDLTSNADTIKGMLEQARNYAMANNTYTWIGFAGSVGSNTTAVTGQVAVAIVASKDGTSLGTDSTGTSPLPTASIAQVGKLVIVGNAHVGDTGVPAPDGSEFESRPNVNVNYRVGASGTSHDTTHPFTVQQTTFNRWIQFSPRGEALVKGGSTDLTPYAEVGVLPAHGTVLGVTKDPATGRYQGNLAAIQISGMGGNVKIYRR